MATATHIPIELYLHSSYEPDADYVDGEIQERHVGEFDHNAVQKALLVWFYLREQQWQVKIIQEQRMRVSATRVRIPDSCVYGNDFQVEQVFTRPPLICIEVLSPEDRHLRIQERITDYIHFGVKNIWVIDPQTQTGWDCSSGAWIPVGRFTVAGTEIELPLADLFASMR
jgi:Uma2 family endonuclease